MLVCADFMFSTIIRLDKVLSDMKAQLSTLPKSHVLDAYVTRTNVSMSLYDYMLYIPDSTWLYFCVP